jgi:hypothetical protein
MVGKSLTMRKRRSRRLRQSEVRCGEDCGPDVVGREVVGYPQLEAKVELGRALVLARRDRVWAGFRNAPGVATTEALEVVGTRSQGVWLALRLVLMAFRAKRRRCGVRDTGLICQKLHGSTKERLNAVTCARRPKGCLRAFYRTARSSGAPYVCEGRALGWPIHQSGRDAHITKETTMIASATSAIRTKGIGTITTATPRIPGSGYGRCDLRD